MIKELKLNPDKLNNISRVALVNHSSPVHKNEPVGRVFEKWGIQVELSIQDDGRTLKIFIKDKD